MVAAVEAWLVAQPSLPAVDAKWLAGGLDAREEQRLDMIDRRRPRYGVTYLKGCFRPSFFSAYDTWF